MTIDDPGWGGLIGDDDKSAPAEPTPQPPADYGAEQVSPPSDAGSLLPPDMKAVGPPPSPVQNRRLTMILVIIAVCLGVVGGGAAGVVVALSGHKANTTTTTLSRGGTQPTTGGTGSSRTLIADAPSALSGTCQETPTSDFVTSSVTDEIACDTEAVSGSEADIIGYARFGSGAALDSYFNSMLSLNGLTGTAGDCTSEQLSGSGTNGTFCEGGYTDSNSVSGNELMFLGSSFTVGGAQGSSTTFCQANFPNSSGVSVVAWADHTDDTFGFALDCTASPTTFVDGMQSNLLHAAYELSDD